MKNNSLLSILILIVIVVAAYLIVQTVRESSQAATAPFQTLNEQNRAMQTQVANLLNPTPTIIPDPVTYINEIRALARLETIQYSVSQVMTGEDRQGTLGFAFGTKILVVVHGSVIAGIDMEKIQPGDMRLENGVLYVNLPPAEVLAVTLDTEKVEVYTLQEGVLADVDPTLVLQTVQGGQDKILSVALDDGILQQAERNAEAYLLRFFSALGYDTVVFPQN